MKTWMWITLAVLLLAVIGYAIYARTQVKKAEAEAKLKEQQLAGLGGGNQPKSSKLAEILDSLVPFLTLVKS